MGTPNVNGHNNTKQTFTVKNIPKTKGEMIIKLANNIKDIDGLTENAINLMSTEAGKEAVSMETRSNKQYKTPLGYIAAEIWNPYAKAHGGKEISGSISVKDAMNSITTYTVKEQAEVKKAQAEELKANSETGQRPEQGI